MKHLLSEPLLHFLAVGISDVIAATKVHYKVAGPWYGIPLATITIEVDAKGVMQMLEAALIGR